MESTRYTVDGKDFELQHYGVKGMKWGVRRTKRRSAAETKNGDAQPTSSEKSWSRQKKLAVGMAATAAVLASAYGAYTVSRAYGSAIGQVRKDAQRMARAMAKPYSFENSKFDRKEFNLPKYVEYYESEKNKGLKKILNTPIREILRPELRKQGRLVSRTATSVRKRVAPDMFDVTGPESFQKIWSDYRKNDHELWRYR